MYTFQSVEYVYGRYIARSNDVKDGDVYRALKFTAATEEEARQGLEDFIIKENK